MRKATLEEILYIEHDIANDRAHFEFVENNKEMIFDFVKSTLKYHGGGRHGLEIDFCKTKIP